MKIFTPGPTEVRKDVLKKMSSPMFAHDSKEFKKLYKKIQVKIKKVFATKNNVFIASSSGLGIMEACARNTVRKNKKVLNFICGAHSERWANVFSACGIKTNSLKAKWGLAIKPEDVKAALFREKYDAVCLTHIETSTGVENPIKEIAKIMKDYPDTLFLVDASSSLGGIPVEVDKLGIDVCLAGAQKALATPPGISVFSVSKKAMLRAVQVENRGLYFDFLEFLRNDKNSQTVSTGPIPQMYALDKELDIIFKEGLKKRYLRHKEMAKIVKAWANTYFEDFAETGYSAVTLTTITNTRKIDFNNLNNKLSKRGHVICNGYGRLKDKTFKISHMGEIYPKDIKILISDINKILNLK